MGDATTLNNMGEVYRVTGQPQEALKLYQQALPMQREVGDRAMEAATLSNLAVCLYLHFQRQQEAIAYMGQAITILHQMGLPEDAAGQKIENLQQALQAMQKGE